MTEKLKRKMQDHLDNLTKPKGSLGDLESFAMKLSEIQGRVPPVIERKITVVFAGDQDRHVHDTVSRERADGDGLFPGHVRADTRGPHPEPHQTVPDERNGRG